MSELKPCPFCGGKASVMDNANEEVSYGAFGYGTRGYPTWYRCYCTECGAAGEPVRIEKGGENNTFYEKYTKEKAIEAWNRRANDEQIH